MGKSKAVVLDELDKLQQFFLLGDVCLDTYTAISESDHAVNQTAVSHWVGNDLVDATDDKK